jgi:hypothetical protein
MRDESTHDAIGGRVRQFEASVQRMALDMVETIFRQELERLEQGLRGRSVKASPKRVTPKRTSQQPAVPAPSVQEATPVRSGRKAAWTREAIIEQLVMFLVGKTAVDAAFISRHGPRGLVAAARKVFGRFEAAMNVASLRVSQLYPDGPPNRGGR